MEFEGMCARLEVQDNMKDGMPILFVTSDERHVTRDDLNSPEKITDNNPDIFCLFALPVNFSPSQREKDAHGMSDEVDVIITTAKQDWIDRDMPKAQRMNTLHWRIYILGSEYRVANLNDDTLFGGEFLYIVFGLRKAVG